MLAKRSLTPTTHGNHSEHRRKNQEARILHDTSCINPDFLKRIGDLLREALVTQHRLAAYHRSREGIQHVVRAIQRPEGSYSAGDASKDSKQIAKVSGAPKRDEQCGYDGDVDNELNSGRGCNDPQNEDGEHSSCIFQRNSGPKKQHSDQNRESVGATNAIGERKTAVRDEKAHCREPPHGCRHPPRP